MNKDKDKDDTPLKIDNTVLRKMMFIANAIEGGWSVKKQNDNYLFTKKHENRREIFQENYLETFLLENSRLC